MGDDQRLWNRLAESYARKPVKDPAAYARTLARTRTHLKPADQVLEIGCGTGTTALALCEAVGRITGIDTAAGMVAIAKRRRAESGPGNLDFVQADACDARFAPRAYDAVLAFNLLHLVSDRGALFARVRELLKPGGVFVSKTVCLGELRLSPLPFVLPLLRRAGVAPQVAVLRAADLEAQIAAAGFEVVEAAFHNARPPGRFIVGRRRG